MAEMDEPPSSPIPISLTGMLLIGGSKDARGQILS